MKLDFISQPSSKSNLPFAGLQHIQQCQVNWHSIFAPGFWSKCMVPEKWSPQLGFELTTSQSWVFCLNHLDLWYNNRLFLIKYFYCMIANKSPHIMLNIYIISFSSFSPLVRRDIGILIINIWNHKSNIVFSKTMFQST
jgi:hypothetical protein